MTPERVVSLRPSTVAPLPGLLLGVAIALWVAWIARQVLTWVFVSAFLAMALNPAVGLLQARGLRHRAAAAAVMYLLAIAAVALLGWLFVPPLLDQVGGFGRAVPGYAHQLTSGEGPLGFLERDYHVVEKARAAVSGGDGGGGGAKLLGGAGTLVSLTRSVITGVVGFVTILFLTFFMILEGPTWVNRALTLLPAASRPRWRNVGRQISRTISGYASGNLVLSAIAGASSAIVLALAGVPFPVALGLLVAILDLVPLAGATIAGIVLAIVAFLTSITAGVIVVAFFVVYQQLENHVLQPLVYGRTVQLSPLVVLVAILIGAEVAGVLGALGAIPVAGTLQIRLADARRHRAKDQSERDGQAGAVAAEA